MPRAGALAGSNLSVSLRRLDRTAWLAISDSNFDVQREYFLFELSAKFAMRAIGGDCGGLCGELFFLPHVRSQAAGERVMASLVAFLEGKLRLRVNRAKSAVVAVMERSFLGHRLLPAGGSVLHRKASTGRRSGFDASPGATGASRSTG
jgi:hypothetical protein